ncbi:hypothetical protein MACK_002194 [Theileria orientalis]|uniref:Uncharacterized protein n=1 Tax=Theileria orientalis TaxID=68886 RepID=A0A976MBQ5_THEOR|nr:hypothetical protein MACK_002194 [Theileria orientalis]
MLLGIYSASTSNVDVTLNLSRPSTIHFRVEPRPESHYELLKFLPNQSYKIAAIVDSAIDIWKKQGEAILESVDVYYKKYVPQIISLNFLKCGERYSEHYGRDNGTFSKVEQCIFELLVFLDNFMDSILFLDVERGFSYSYFYWKEVEIEGKQFIEYYPKKSLELAKFTCGKDSLVKGPEGKILKKILRRQVNKNEELLQMVIRDSVKGKYTKCYHMRNNIVQPVSLSTFKRLCEPLPRSIDKNVPNLSHLPDIHDKLPEDYQSDDETETKEPQVNPEDSSQKVSTSSEPPTMAEAIHTEIKKRYNNDGTRRLSATNSPKTPMVDVIRNQIEMSTLSAKERARERAAQKAIKNMALPSLLPTVSVTPARSQTPERQKRSERLDTSKSFLRSRVLDVERSQSSYIPIAPEEPDQPPKPNESLVLETEEEHISSETLHDFMAEQEKSEHTLTDPFYEVITERTHEPLEKEPLHEPVVSKESSEDLGTEQSQDLLVSPKCSSSKKAPKNDSGTQSKQSESVTLKESYVLPEDIQSIPDKYFESNIIYEKEKWPSPDTLKEIFEEVYLEEESKRPEGLHDFLTEYLGKDDLAKDDLEKPVMDSEGTETVAETEIDYPELGKVEEEQSSDPRDCESEVKNTMDVYPQVLEVIESQAKPGYEEKIEGSDQERTEESQFVDSIEIALYLDADDDEESFQIFKQERKNGFCVKVYKPKFKLVAVKNTLPLWVADMSEVKCIDAELHKYYEEPWAVKLNIETAEGLKISRFFNPSRYSEISEDEHSKLVYELSRKAEKPEPTGLTLNLAYPDQPHVLVNLITNEYNSPYVIYSPLKGYSFTSVYLNQKLVWKASQRYPFADSVIYYTHLGRPAYAILNIPESSLFIKEITIDLLTMKKVTNLSQTQLNYLLEFNDLPRQLDFNLADPIDTVQYKVSKVHFKGFMVRTFSADTRRVTMIYDGERPVTPANIIPFRDFKVYYFKNLPVFILTDPYLGPGYFKRTSSGWTSSTMTEVNADLEAIRLDLEDTSIHPRTFISLDYDLARDKNFLVEMGRRRRVPYKSFVPVMGNIISRIFCSWGFLLSERERKRSSGVTFFLKDSRPYKAELLINARAGLKKMVFKVLEHESRQWTEVDESVFLKY